MGVVQWHAGEHLQGWVSLLAEGFSVTSEQSDHVTVWGQNALLLCPKTVGFTLMHGKIITKEVIIGISQKESE